MKKQRGLSLSGLIAVCFILIVVALLGFKLFSPYMEFFTIQKTFKEIANDPEVKNGTIKDVRTAFAKHSMIDNTSAIGSDDLEISKDGSDIAISASYSVKVPLFYNISLVIDFNPSSAN